MPANPVWPEIEATLLTTRTITEFVVYPTVDVDYDVAQDASTTKHVGGLRFQEGVSVFRRAAGP